MIKREEIADPGSCLNRAADDEYIFSLLGRDRAIAATMRFWATERVRLGLNLAGDTKIVRALADADTLERAHAVYRDGPAAVDDWPGLDTPIASRMSPESREVFREAAAEAVGLSGPSPPPDKK